MPPCLCLISQHRRLPPLRSPRGGQRGGVWHRQPSAAAVHGVGAPHSTQTPREEGARAVAMGLGGRRDENIGKAAGNLWGPSGCTHPASQGAVIAPRSEQESINTSMKMLITAGI